MNGEGQANRSLDVLPQSISDVHGHLRNAIDTLCVLEDFLLGSQVRDVQSTEGREPPSGVVDKCFDNVTAISNRINECHEQLRHIMEKLGAASKR